MHRFPRRLWLACFLVLSFLTVQLAAAAYACAGDRYAASPAPSADEMASMAESCPDMAKHAPQDSDRHDGLCLEHCQADTKTADHVSPQVPAFLPRLVGLIEPTPVATMAPRSMAHGDAIARAPPPPLPILHCCFRT
ncbi:MULTISPECIES: hypothetical protein [Ralstonia solanacearum species complex]|uniref:Copper resistance protein n=3 Tax=Ralstonia solanacearum species complex TaxID=3116862 RepID=A0A7U7JCZ7_RALSL|nr:MULTISPECIES: hypothetical protein [Ralstonia solanacearum species complex]ALF91040.1 hypothetical protein RSUY_47380 [Ralstonia solanacearum]ATI30442.1 copper resistance protein [Ralstonia solanacearum]EAP73366.1 Hypothetical Protein RRSL_03056 [Ralstonia solanacearum UW551]KEI31154.1 hypothetical protein CQ06_00940 [Ralstonia solanacearum]KFX77601.1 copper/silver resistance transmembrane protein SilD [Ralstonia solanacearum]